MGWLMPLSKHFAKRHARKRAQGEQNKLYIIQRQTNTRSKSFRRSPGCYSEKLLCLSLCLKKTQLTVEKWWQKWWEGSEADTFALCHWVRTSVSIQTHADFFFCYFSRHDHKHSFSSTNKLYKHDPVSIRSKRYSWELAFWLGAHLLFSCLSVLGILGACSQLVLRKDVSRQCVSNNPVSSMTKIYACAGCPLRSGQWRTDKL